MGVAESIASAGIPVIVRDVDATAVGAAHTRIGRSLERAAERRKLSVSEAADIHARIDHTADLDEIAEAELVIEAVPENSALKAELLRQVAGIVPDGTLIASNTSSIPIVQLAAQILRPEPHSGLHVRCR